MLLIWIGDMMRGHLDTGLQNFNHKRERREHCTIRVRYAQIRVPRRYYGVSTRTVIRDCLRLHRARSARAARAARRCSYIANAIARVTLRAAS